MKRLAIVLSIIILLAMLLPSFSMLAQPAYIPHQNPATAKDSPDPASLLLFYGNVSELISISQYQDAQNMLNELEYANIPDELRYIVDHYNTLAQQLLTTLDNLELLLDEASTLLAHYQISEAQQKLDEAAIHSTQLLLEDIETATDTMGDRLGVSAAPAYNRLEEILHHPIQLTDELNQLQQRLTEKHKAQVQGGLIPAELSLSITPASVFVGDSITASGRLTSYNRPLANRKLIIFLDDNPQVITTDLDGSYTSNITIPYKYVSTMTLSAVYTASDYDDFGAFLGCVSSPVVVNTSFYPTLLQVSAPETAYPGLPITISGQVSSTDGAVDRTIKVLLDNTQLAKEIIQGQFSLQVAPPQISTGKHSLTLAVTPRGHYSGASKSLPINISTQILIQADIQTPQLSVIPKPIKISGKVYHSLGPLQDARVRLTFKDSSTSVKTSTDGSFTATIEAPLDLSLVGPKELAITIEPVEPGYASLQIKRQIFTINPANIGLMLLLISLGLLAYNRIRTRPPSRREEIIVPEAKPRELPAVVLPPRPKYEFTGIKGRMLSAYLDGLEAVERVTGISMAPHTTLREFLNAITPRLLTAIKPFTELTIVAEIALYSAHRLDPDSAARAEQLTGIIKEELHSGAS